MNIEDIKTAEAEANRFLERVEAAKAAFKNHNGHWWNHDTTATAALRRASMDLTRALAQLRRPGA
ncbi:hypothetical protein [Novosphingobium olei]|uniref:hypothetical protein n=1 Tax=Novosphingobium olei TaxID=2728851 RepID=UPI003090A448|nr:hypothetical protein NSDW_12010 [Novosphingobium olei]